MANLTQVKVGDVIAIDNRSPWDKSCLLILSTVERLTATQVACSNGNRFKKDNGSLIGGGYKSGFVPTPEQLEKDRLYRIEYKRKHDAIIWLDKNVINKRNKLTVEQIEAMRFALEVEGGKLDDKPWTETEKHYFEIGFVQGWLDRHSDTDIDEDSTAENSLCEFYANTQGDA
jgi:hypothetical protein